MSPRAACRLAQLGLEEVYDYAGGKLDWLAHGKPYEGDADLVARHLQRVPTCAADDRAAVVIDRLGDAPVLAVTSPSGIVVGAVRPGARPPDASAPVADVMEAGPTTVRPSEERAALDERMAVKDVGSVLVTDPAGRLLGLYRR
jgi:hypothetical protein